MSDTALKWVAGFFLVGVCALMFACFDYIDDQAAKDRATHAEAVKDRVTLVQCGERIDSAFGGIQWALTTYSYANSAGKRVQIPKTCILVQVR